MERESKPQLTEEEVQALHAIARGRAPNDLPAVFTLRVKGFVALFEPESQGAYHAITDRGMEAIGLRLPMRVGDAPGVMVQRCGEEWQLAWAWLKRMCPVGDGVAMNPVSYESWQYMGSAWYPREGWVHQFRHRDHPMTGLWERRDVPASGEWWPQEGREWGQW